MTKGKWLKKFKVKDLKNPIILFSIQMRIQTEDWQESIDCMVERFKGEICKI